MHEEFSKGNFLNPGKRKNHRLIWGLCSSPWKRNSSPRQIPKGSERNRYSRKGGGDCLALPGPPPIHFWIVSAKSNASSGKFLSPFPITKRSLRQNRPVIQRAPPMGEVIVDCKTNEALNRALEEPFKTCRAQGTGCARPIKNTTQVTI